MGHKSGENLGVSYCHGLGGNQVLNFLVFICSSAQALVLAVQHQDNMITNFEFFQVFAYTRRQQIMSDDNCLDATSPEGPVKLVRCHGMGGNQLWVYDKIVSVLCVLPVSCYNYCFGCGMNNVDCVAGSNYQTCEYRPVLD